MAPTLTNPALSLHYGGWEDEPGIAVDSRWRWSGFEDVRTKRTLYLVKHLREGWELEFYQGVPPSYQQIGEVTEGKISLRGRKWYTEQIYSKREGFWHKMGDSLVLKSPFDERSYIWSHKQVWDTYTMTVIYLRAQSHKTDELSSTKYQQLTDAETKECIVKTKDKHHKKEPDVLEFSDRAARMLEFVLLSMLQYRREIYKGNKEFADAVVDGLKG
ncbi:hypothetical protein P7C70_g2164, partial [Phenoliferia sp. Uapishka_3]